MPFRLSPFGFSAIRSGRLQLPKLRLSHQLLGFFVLVVLIPLLLLSFSIYSINQKALQKQVRRFTQDTAEATIHELDQDLNWQLSQGQMASQYWLSMCIPGGLQQATASILHNSWTRCAQGALSYNQTQLLNDFFKRYPDYKAVAVYDAGGHRLRTFVPNSLHPQNSPLPATLTTSNQEDINLKLLPRRHHPVINGSRVTQYDLLMTIPLDRVLPSDQHRVAKSDYGSIAFLKQYDTLNNLVGQKLKTFGQGFVIADNQYRIIAGPASWLDKPLPLSDQETLKSIKTSTLFEGEGLALHIAMSLPKGTLPKAKPKSSPQSDDDNMVEKIYYTFPQMGWHTLIESPYSVEQQFIHRARLQSVALVILCIVIIIVLGLLYSRGINRNFRQLIKGIKAFAEGHYSRRIRLITKSWTPYEIIFLAAEFNRMALKIAKAWGSIQQLNQELVLKTQQDEFLVKATQQLHNSLELDRVCQSANQLMCERPYILGSRLLLIDSSATKGQSPLIDMGHACQAPSSPESTSILVSTQLILFNPQLDTELERFYYADTPIIKPQSMTALKAHWVPEGRDVQCLPLVYQDQPLGWLVLLVNDAEKQLNKPERDDETPYHDDAIVTELLAAQITVAIHQSQQWQELQAANAKLAKLDDMKSNLIDTVSHELRTPLTSIKGYTSRLIRNDENLPRDMRLKSLKIVKQQADRLERLVNDLLVIPDIEREGSLRVYLDQVELGDLVQRCVTFMEEKAHRPIRVHGLNTPVDILADPDRLEQVLLNLLDNASKYSDEDAHIDIMAQPYGKHMILSVYNPCPPIPAYELNQLFEKFKRLDERLTRTTRGTGLGLFIAKGLVEAMGGRIALEGHDGFRVILTLPLFSHSERPLSDLSH